MKYKRLTMKNARGFYHYNCTKKEQKDCEIWEDCDDCYGSKARTRLGELEDKIEQGTLIELPCKVGDVFYGIQGNDFFKCHIHAIKITKKNTLLETLYGMTFVFGEEAFLTLEQAKKRLKELQE